LDISNQPKLNISHSHPRLSNDQYTLTLDDIVITLPEDVNPGELGTDGSLVECELVLAVDANEVEKFQIKMYHGKIH